MMRQTNPFDDLERTFERMTRQFENVNGWSPDEMDVSMHAVDLDVTDYDDELVVVADLPGFETDDIDVSVSERTLTIRAEREHEQAADADGEYLRRERRSSSLRRSLTLPADVDEDAASASYTNGVLTVSLPKLDLGESEDAHHIDVN